MTSTLQDRLRDMLPGLPPNSSGRRAGRWTIRPRSAQVHAAPGPGGVAPATMLRMARAAGCDT